jgi:hypothetical protein
MRTGGRFHRMADYLEAAGHGRFGNRRAEARPARPAISRFGNLYSYDKGSSSR